MGDRSVYSVAKAAGLSHSLLKSYLTKTRPGADKLAALASVLGVRLEWLATGKGQAPPRSPAETVFLAKDLVAVPIYPVEIGAGVPTLALAQHMEPEGHHPLSLNTARQITTQPSALVALTVRGTSMEPRIKDGWVAIIDTTRTLIRPRGGTYAIRLDDELVVKNVRWEGDSLVLASENPDFPPRVIDPPDAERVQVLGYVPICFAPSDQGTMLD